MNLMRFSLDIMMNGHQNLAKRTQCNLRMNSPWTIRYVKSGRNCAHGFTNPATELILDMRSNGTLVRTQVRKKSWFI
jgi:hypothetical protein